MESSRSNKKSSWKTPLAILVILIHSIPLYVLLGVAFKSPQDLSSRWVFPTYINWENFSIAINKGKIGQSLITSTIITVTAIIFITLIGALASYPLARNRCKFNTVIKSFVLGIMMVPPLSILVPLYSMVARIHGTSTYWAIITILITFQLPMSIFLYTNFISSIPMDLDEAAAIDGCGPIQTFFKIILPQLKPVTASVIILTGVSCWNDYQFSLYILQSPNVRTVTQSIASFFSQFSSNINAAAAASLLGILPVVVLFLFLQKYFIKGMIDSAIK